MWMLKVDGQRFFGMVIVGSSLLALHLGSVPLFGVRSVERAAIFAQACRSWRKNKNNARPLSKLVCAID
jgi:hypothetical protein